MQIKLPQAGGFSYVIKKKERNGERDIEKEKERERERNNSIISARNKLSLRYT